MATPDARVRTDQLTLRLDHNLTGQQQLSFYYYGEDGYDSEPFNGFLASGTNLPDFGNRTRERFQQLNLSHVWTITAKTNNESRFVFYRKAVHKTVVLRERTNLEFRTEFFNLLNHTQFLNPDGNITDGPTFGQVTRARDPRLVQFALRLTF